MAFTNKLAPQRTAIFKRKTEQKHAAGSQKVPSKLRRQLTASSPRVPAQMPDFGMPLTSIQRKPADDARSMLASAPIGRERAANICATGMEMRGVDARSTSVLRVDVHM